MDILLSKKQREVDIGGGARRPERFHDYLRSNSQVNALILQLRKLRPREGPCLK